MKAERGFTLIEFLVVVCLVAILTFGIVTLTLARHPGELASAARSFDASLDAARAIAATSGNGATIVVAPRTQKTTQNTPLPGFILTVYRGRPTAANAVSATTVMPIVSDISVKEATLGSPPFAIFLSSAGHASGLAAYPSFDSSGNAVFSAIAQQPSCPSGSLTLTFTGPNATQTRTLSCHTLAIGTPQPVTTATPAPIVVTPAAVVFYWPSAPAQTFSTTEWGYTRWFAASNFACGANVAAFPASAPSPPYSAAYSLADASATPQPPTNVPYAFANSAISMEDAPASFSITPQNAGVCAAVLQDANAQQATLNVQVMGALTFTPSVLTFMAGGGMQTAVLGKTFDITQLQANIVSSTCSNIASIGLASGTIPTQLGIQASTTLVNVTPQLPGSCSVRISDQYSAFGDPSATLTINVSATPSPTPMPTPSPTPQHSPTPLPSPTKTPTACVVSSSTLVGADGSCDDLYQWPIISWNCSQFNCALLYPTGHDNAPTDENAWAAVYVPHGTVVTYDTETNANEPSPAFYTCYANINSAVTPTVFAYFYSDGSHPTQTFSTRAGFGLAQIANAASIPHDPAQPPVTVPSFCTPRLPGPTFAIGG